MTYQYPAYIQLGENRFRERFGLDFEDFKVGQLFKHRPGYTFSQQDNSDECLDTQNQAMLHFDAQYVSHTEFKSNLVVTTTIVQRLMGMTWKTFNRRKAILHWNYCNMLAPVYGGDTLYAESEITAVDDGDEESGLVTARLRSFNQEQVNTCEMEFAALVYKKDFLPFDKHNY